MGVQVEPLNQCSFDQHGPWHYRDIPFLPEEHVDFSAALLHATALPSLNTRLTQISKVNNNNNQQRHGHKLPQEVDESSVKPSKPVSSLAPVQLFSKPLSPPIPTTKATAILGPSGSWPALASTGTTLPKKEVISFPLKQMSPPPPRPNLKRRRPNSDVDGLNTASLGSKKRRLLRHNTTSRLSAPFSSPATHIINRESAATGDKRFLKIAAIVGARRLNAGGGGQWQQSQTPPQQHHPSPSSLLRRAAVINRFRLRVSSKAAERGDAEASMAVSNVGLLRQSPGVVGMVVGARFPAAAAPPLGPPIPTLRVPYQNLDRGAPRPGGGVRPSPPGSPADLRPTELTCPGLRLPPSPLLRALRSPELRSSRPPIDVDDIDDLDDENVAFPTSEHESRYDDEPDDVYSDFGLIFGGGGECEASDDDGVEHYEDYMDDLDGIPWNARC
ncbi:hypothetical protein B0H63DRAFT_496080 [Podospora didyma]|uniref:Uncharacterized protein n=1 Tax=Podospora didyma TaxID=330526 RepID=A0AAE0N934_9PEZI|nr:hypothetical protein B0H63DRAFT_496080 [Podospora didyma]